MATTRYTKSSSAMMLTMTVSIHPPYNFSHSMVYRAATTKKVMITATKITSLILVSMSATNWNG
ncbi:MAG: hypothetical protein ACM3NN_12465 [Nitrospirota bacterium]